MSAQTTTPETVTLRIEWRPLTDAQVDEMDEVGGWEPEVIYTNIDRQGTRWFIRNGDVFETLEEAAR